MKLNGPERPLSLSNVFRRVRELIKPPSTAELIRRRSPWEFPVPDSPDGRPQWLGFNRDGDGAKNCMSSITGPSKDVSKATP